jgi:hypothetical protein
MRYYLHLAQPLAIYFSQTLQQPAAKKDLETIQWAWEKIDPYGAWVIESLDALRSISPSTSTQTLASVSFHPQKLPTRSLRRSLNYHIHHRRRSNISTP